MSIQTDIQKLEIDAEVHLYSIDATDLGAPSVYYFCPYTEGDGAPVRWGGVEYTPIDCEITGFEQTSQGSLPHPMFRITNVNKTLAGTLVAFDDLLGAIVTRKRTLKKYLDGEDFADPDAGFPEDVYIVTRKVTCDRTMIELELSAYLDSEQYTIPSFLMLADVCQWNYRVYSGGSFVYDTSDRACPYHGTSYFDAEGNVTTAANDVCGQELADCKLRYPGKQVLPISAIPGLGRSSG